jgi:hypothetical protein
VQAAARASRDAFRPGGRRQAAGPYLTSWTLDDSCRCSPPRTFLTPSTHVVSTRSLSSFDPESEAGAALRPALPGPLRFTSSAERSELVRGVEDPESLASADAHEWVRRAGATLGLTLSESRPVLHSVARKLLARLRTSGLEDDMSLEGHAELSPRTFWSFSREFSSFIRQASAAGDAADTGHRSARLLRRSACPGQSPPDA